MFHPVMVQRFHVRENVGHDFVATTQLEINVLFSL
jgi:hypothetical protein